MVLPLLVYLHYIPAILGGYTLYKLFFPVASHTSTGIPHLRRIPALAFIEFLLRGPQLIAEGYKKNKPGPFAIPLFTGTEIVLTDPSHITSLIHSHESVISGAVGTEWSLQALHTLPGLLEPPSKGKLLKNAYYAKRMLTLIRGKFSPGNIEAYYPAMFDELKLVLKELMPENGDGWKEFGVQELCMAIIARMSSRVTVGKPLCRDSTFLKHAIHYAHWVIFGSAMIKPWPSWMKPTVAKIVLGRLQAQIIAHMRPHIEMLAKEKSHENTVVSGMLETPGITQRKDCVTGIAQQVQLFNFAALHSTATHFSHLVFHLAHNPAHAEQLREALKSITDDPIAIDNNPLLDSFLKETQRLTPVSSVAIGRVVMQPTTFPGSEAAPSISFAPGDRVIAVSQLLLSSAETWSDPGTFDISRFVRLREKQASACGASINDIEAGTFASTDVNFFVFGHGRRICLGRWFAGATMKMAIAKLLADYEFEGVGKPGEGGWWKEQFPAVEGSAMPFGWSWLLAPGVKVRVRRRVEA